LPPEFKQENIVSKNDVFIPSPNIVIDYHQNKNETDHYPSQVELSSSRTSQLPHIQDGIYLVGGGSHRILDTGELFHANPEK
jgi:hypothetical protein